MRQAAHTFNAHDAVNVPLRRLQAATGLTSLGKWAFQLALGVFAFRHGGTTAVGVVAFAMAAPAAAGAPALGLAADRYSRRQILLFTNLARAALLGAVAAAMASSVPPLAVYVLAAVFSVVSTASQPARSALIPALARSAGEVATATSLTAAADTLGFLLGAGVGALVLASTTIPFVVALCCLTYALASAVMWLVPRDERPPRRAGERRRTAIAAGARTILSEGKLRLAATFFAAQSIVEGLLGVLVIAASIDLLHIGAAGIGYLNIARGVGGICAGAAAYRLLNRARLASAIAAGSVVLGVPMLALGVFPRLGVGIVAWAGAGAGLVLIRVASVTLAQRLAGDRVLARVLAVMETSYVALTGIGALMASALVALLGLRGTLLAVGAFLPLLTLLRRRSLRGEAIAEPPPPLAFALVRGCPVFAALPLAAMENLAARMVPLSVAAGTDVVVQGDDADAFFLIASGTVEVFEDGVRRRTMGAGEGFGEIALLRDVPRTATVRAREAADLLAIDREQFLLTVTGHADAHESALETADMYASPSGARA
ncbi:MAG TPA: MFS transporter [Solirubrobacteraceae bacterium]|nr:MFS transporter [Solirubrobacteraceae bacterium]